MGVKNVSFCILLTRP